MTVPALGTPKSIAPWYGAKGRMAPTIVEHPPCDLLDNAEPAEPQLPEPPHAQTPEEATP